MSSTPGSLDTRMAASIHRAATAWSEPGLGIPGPPAWFDQAACAGQPDDVFYPNSVRDDRTVAIAICNTCPVRNQCLEYAVANRERYGIWGGQTEAQIAALISTSSGARA